MEFVWNIIQKLPPEFIIKKGKNVLIVLVSSVLPTAMLFYIWNDKAYYDRELVRTIILILAVSLCTYVYYWLIAYIGDTLVYRSDNDDESGIYKIISAAFMNAFGILISILILLFKSEIYSKKFYVGIVLFISVFWLFLSWKESKIHDKYLKQIKYRYMEEVVSQNKDICNTYNKGIDEIVKLDKKIENKQSALKILQIEHKNIEKVERS